MSANPAIVWASVFVDELARAGVTSVCVAPGSRSTPLTMAFAAHPDFRVYSHLDERSAAFFALGIGLATGTPAAVLCTSGTAAANFFPAVIEAHESRVPLLVLTTDRPHELRGTGANQTIDQVKLYGNYVRFFRDMAVPEREPAGMTIRYLRTTADRAADACRGPLPGPVHLNFPFRKPFEPDGQQQMPFDLGARPGGAPFTVISRAQPGAPEPPALDLPEDGFILAGPNCAGGDFPFALVELAEKTGYPLIADVLSGLRFGPWTGQVPILNPQVCTLFTARQQHPSLILQFGAVPTSKPVMDFLEGLPHSTRRVSIQASGMWQDDAHTLTDLVHADPLGFCRSLTESLPPWHKGSSSWAAALRQAESDYWHSVRHHAEAGYFEGLVLADIVDGLPNDSLLFVANSNPVRHLDEFVRASDKQVRVLANRGASGIDGTISTALGAAVSSDQPLVLVLGDISFYHDMNGLLALKRCGVRATIVLINNDGGGIFHRLPVAQHDPPFTDLFLTPHGLNFEPAAHMYGADYVLAANRSELKDALAQAVGNEQPYIIEIRTDSAHHEKVRQSILKWVWT